MDYYKDFAHCVTTSSINNSTTTIPVDETGRIPSTTILAKSEFFMTLIDMTTPTAPVFEIVQVTNKSTSSGAGNLTVVRAQGGSTAASFPSGVELKSALFKEELLRVRAFLSGTGAPPTADTDLHTTGDPYARLNTDGSVSLYVLDATQVWRKVGWSWLSTWNSGTAYKVGDVVKTVDGYAYICLVAHTNSNPAPAAANSNWAALNLPLRQTTQVTSSSLANLASQQTTIALPSGYRLYRIETDVPARVRLYTTQAKQIADASRIVGIDPTGDHGVMLDFVTFDGATPVLSADLSPTVDGFDGSVSPSGSVFITITNLSGATDTVTVTLSYSRTL